MIRRLLSSRLPVTLFGRLYIGQAATVRRAEHSTVSHRRRAVVAAVTERTGNVVQAGLFHGTVLPAPLAWGAEDYAAMLLGTYECELHPALGDCVEARPDVVINLGCANGLYAAGLARLLPGCPIVAVDISAAAMTATTQAWELNGLAGLNPLQLVHGPATFPTLTSWLEPYDRPLIVSDIEGHERELLDPKAVPLLARSTIVVELHDEHTPGTTTVLRNRLEGTHRLTFITSGARNPHEIELLGDFEEHDRWLALSEARSRDGSWMVAVPR